MSDQVRLMFSDIAESYDLGNDVISFGMHRVWKRRLVRETGIGPGEKGLDIATGTGDIADLMAQRVEPGGSVIGIDFSAAMIARARERSRELRLPLRFEIGDCLDLRFPSDTFDVATISYGIRNVDDPVAGLREICRVLKPGGRIGVIETGAPDGAWGRLYGLYSRRVVPFVGGLVSGNEDAYDYLNRTSAVFPSGEQFVAMMKEAGFGPVRSIPLLGGVAWIYIGSPR